MAASLSSTLRRVMRPSSLVVWHRVGVARGKGRMISLLLPKSAGHRRRRRRRLERVRRWEWGGLHVHEYSSVVTHVVSMHLDWFSSFLLHLRARVSEQAVGRDQVRSSLLSPCSPPTTCSLRLVDRSALVKMDVTMAAAVVPQDVPLEPPIAATTTPQPDLALPAEIIYALVCNWKGQKLDLNVVASDTVGDLKAMLWSLTSVPVDRQKIVGLVKGKLPGDEAEVVSLGLLQGGGAPKPFMMVSLVCSGGGARRSLSSPLSLVQIGTPEGEEHKEVGPTENRAAEVDIDYSAAQEAAHVAAQGVRNR